MATKRASEAQNTPREKPQGVFDVQYYLITAVAIVTAPQQSRGARSTRGMWHAPRGTLVNTSVNLKPTKLVDVALDVLARLAPCLNLGVGELGHKDLLDTIGANNCRK